MCLTYTINRHQYFPAYGIGSNTLDIKLGTINTGVLILSSLTMAMSVWSAQVGKKGLVTGFLIATLALGKVFLGIKVVENKQKVDHHLILGHCVDVRYHVDNTKPEIEMGKKLIEDQRA